MSIRRRWCGESTTNDKQKGAEVKMVLQKNVSAEGEGSQKKTRAQTKVKRRPAVPRGWLGKGTEGLSEKGKCPRGGIGCSRAEKRGGRKWHWTRESGRKLPENQNLTKGFKLT